MELFMKKYSKGQIEKIERFTGVKFEAFSVNERENDEQEDNISFYSGSYQHSYTRSEFEDKYLKPATKQTIDGFNT
jgi:hypothetical protein